MQNFLLAQTLLILAGTVLSYYISSEFGAISAAYGGGIALFSSLILVRRANRTFESVSANKGTSGIMLLLYAGVIQRYVFVLLGLGLGLGLLKLKVEPLLAVFGAAQLAYFMPWLGSE